MADLPPGLAALFNLPPERALAFLLAKGLRLTGPYWELDGPLHSQLFTAANLAKIDILADIKDAIGQVIAEGRNERWFRDELVDVLRKKGWWGPRVTVDPVTQEARIIQQGSLRRLQTIYRTNLQSAYLAGRHRQAWEQRARAPYVEYIAVLDSRTRPAHRALDNKVFLIDGPEWSVIAPPNGYNCRCDFRALSQRELDKRGLRPQTDARIVEREPPGKRPVDPLTGQTPERWIQRGISVPDPDSPGGRVYLWADPGWDHLPGSDGAERALIDILMRRATEIGEAVREVVSEAVAAASPKTQPTESGT